MMTPDLLLSLSSRFMAAIGLNGRPSECVSNLLASCSSPEGPLATHTDTAHQPVS